MRELIERFQPFIEILQLKNPHVVPSHAQTQFQPFIEILPTRRREIPRRRSRMFQPFIEILRLQNAE